MMWVTSEIDNSYESVINVKCQIQKYTSYLYDLADTSHITSENIHPILMTWWTSEMYASYDSVRYVTCLEDVILLGGMGTFEASAVSAVPVLAPFVKNRWGGEFQVATQLIGHGSTTHSLTDPGNAKV